MITPEMSSIKKSKRKIYNLKKPHLIPKYEKEEHEVIYFSKKELVLNEEARITTIVLEVGMTRRSKQMQSEESVHRHKHNKEYPILQMFQRNGNE